jgi:hypothetical protein
VPKEQGARRPPRPRRWPMGASPAKPGADAGPGRDRPVAIGYPSARQLTDTASVVPLQGDLADHSRLGGAPIAGPVTPCRLRDNPHNDLLDRR